MHRAGLCVTCEIRVVAEPEADPFGVYACACAVNDRRRLRLGCVRVQMGCVHAAYIVYIYVHIHGGMSRQVHLRKCLRRCLRLRLYQRTSKVRYSHTNSDENRNSKRFSNITMFE